MATWPNKVNYLAGGILTATQMNEIGTAINTLPFQAGKNRVLNSNFSVWQRGTSISVPTNSYGYYTSDRWNLTTGSATPNAHTVSRQATGDTTNLPNIQYCARVQRNSGQTSTSGAIFIQCFESVNSIPLANKQIILSFYARKGADYSPTASALTATIWQGTGTDQNPYTSGYTGQSTSGTAVTLTTTWQRFTYTTTIAANTTEISVGFTNSSTGTAGANDYYEITGVQLEAFEYNGLYASAVASPYAPNSATYQSELAACQRYYWRNSSATGAYPLVSTGYVDSATLAIFPVAMPVEMRTAPSSVDYSSLRVYDAGVLSAVTNLTLYSSTAKVVNLAATTTGLTTGRACALLSGTSGTPYIGISAEL